MIFGKQEQQGHDLRLDAHRCARFAKLELGRIKLKMGKAQ
jgi:hypothetical protein